MRAPRYVCRICALMEGDPASSVLSHRALSLGATGLSKKALMSPCVRKAGINHRGYLPRAVPATA